MSLSPAWGRVAVLCGALVVSCLLVEGGLRLVAGRLPVAFLVYVHQDLKARVPDIGTRLREYAPYSYVHWNDPEVGWVMTTGMTLEGVNEDGEAYAHTISSEGFLTPDTPAAGEASLVLLGDSFLSTYWVSEPLPFALRREVGEPVYNLAVGGWGPESYRAAYEKFARRVDPDRVVVFTFVNDISDVSNWLDWQATAPDVSFPAWLQRHNPNDDPINVGLSWPDRHSFLWNYLRFGLRWVAARTALQAGEPASAGRGRESFGEADGGFELELTADYPFLTRDPDAFLPGGDYFQPMEAYLRSLDRLRESVAHDGAKFLLVSVPAKERVYVPLLPSERRARWVYNGSGEIDGIERVLARFASERDVPFLDLSDGLGRLAAAGQQLYFTRDGHLNQRGNREAAALVARFLRGPAPPAPRPPGADTLLVDVARLDVDRPVSLAATEYVAPLAHVTCESPDDPWCAREPVRVSGELARGAGADAGVAGGARPSRAGTRLHRTRASRGVGGADAGDGAWPVRSGHSGRGTGPLWHRHCGQSGGCGRPPRSRTDHARVGVRTAVRLSS